MAKRKRKRRPGLGYVSIQRFVVDQCMPKRVYTSPVDALLVAKKTSVRSGKACRVSVGLPGAEARIAICEERKCKTPGGKAISMRRLYEAEQGAKPEASGHGKRGRKGARVGAKAKVTRITARERRKLWRKVKKG